MQLLWKSTAYKNSYRLAIQKNSKKENDSKAIIFVVPDLTRFYRYIDYTSFVCV